MTKMIGWVFTNEAWKKADAKGTKEENKKAWEKVPDVVQCLIILLLLLLQIL